MTYTTKQTDILCMVSAVLKKIPYCYGEDSAEWITQDGIISIDFTEKEIQFVKELKEAYDYAKGGRQKLLDDIDNYSLTLEHDNFMTYLDKDKHLNECDTVLCDFVVKNREKFWT